jgi:hypothetical protein
MSYIAAGFSAPADDASKAIAGPVDGELINRGVALCRSVRAGGACLLPERSSTVVEVVTSHVVAIILLEAIGLFCWSLPCPLPSNRHA